MSSVAAATERAGKDCSEATLGAIVDGHARLAAAERAWEDIQEATRAALCNLNEEARPTVLGVLERAKSDCQASINRTSEGLAGLPGAGEELAAFKSRAARCLEDFENELAEARRAPIDHGLRHLALELAK